MRELVKSPSHMRPYARRSGEMRKGVEVVRVATVLRDEHCRPELPQHRRHNAVEPFEPRFVPRERHERQVYGRTAAGAVAGVLGKAGAREQKTAALVERDREHVGLAVEDLLDAVAVVHVDVDVCDAMASILEPATRDRRSSYVQNPEARARCA